MVSTPVSLSTKGAAVWKKPGALIKVYLTYYWQSVSLVVAYGDKSYVKGALWCWPMSIVCPYVPLFEKVAPEHAFNRSTITVTVLVAYHIPVSPSKT